MDKRPIFFAIPKAVDISLLKKTLGKKATQKALYFISRLVSLHAKFPNKKWIEVPSSTLMYFMGNYYTKIIKLLVDLKYVEDNGSWQSGKHSKGYKLLNIDDGRYIPCVDKILLKKIHQSIVKRSVDSKLKASTEVDKWLINSLLDVDIQLPSDLKDITSNVKWLKRIRNDEAVKSIQTNMLDYTVCKHHRRHTPITRLSKRKYNLRKYLYFKSLDKASNEKLYEIDIVNSQLVFILAHLLEQSYDNTCIESIDSGALSLCLHNWQEKLIPFRQAVEGGTFYDQYVKELGYPNRDAVKVPVLKYILYGPIRGEGTPVPIINSFKKAYPEVWQYIQWIKARNYKVFSWMMQKKEADFLFDDVLTKVMKMYPTARILTVHDSIICEEKYVPIIQEIMDNEFMKIGVSAKYKVKLLKSNEVTESTDSGIMEEMDSDEELEEFDEEFDESDEFEPIESMDELLN